MIQKKLYQLLYVSETVTPLATNELENILNVSRVNNKANDITGLLLYNQHAFMQCIEGNKRDIYRLYGIIENDRRHSHVQDIYCKPIQYRHFKGWGMGFRYFNRDFRREDIFDMTVSGLSSSISENQPFPNMRSFMKRYYDVPKHDMFEGWLKTYATQ